MARVRAAKGARKKIDTYVAALVEIQPRLARVYLVLRDAAATLLVSDRGWSPGQFGNHLTDAWQRLFLARAPRSRQ